MIPAGAKIQASKHGATWRAVLAVELPDEYLQAEGEGATKAEAIRAATEAYEDLTAPRKTCRAPNHQGPRELPKTLRHFRQEGERTLRDGSPLLRHVCRLCERAWQAEYHRRVGVARRRMGDVAKMRARSESSMRRGGAGRWIIEADPGEGGRPAGFIHVGITYSVARAELACWRAERVRELTGGA